MRFYVFVITFGFHKFHKKLYTKIYFLIFLSTPKITAFIPKIYSLTIPKIYLAERLQR